MAELNRYLSDGKTQIIGIISAPVKRMAISNEWPVLKWMATNIGVAIRRFWLQFSANGQWPFTIFELPIVAIRQWPFAKNFDA